MKQPRGIRNNNPLNIRATDTRWDGLAINQSDERYCVFQAPHFGIRAAAIVLRAYKERHGIRDLRSVIERWAPPVENNTEAYIQAVEIWADIDRSESIDLTDYATVRALLQAMCRMENGKPPADRPTAWYDDATWEQGLRLAGLAPRKRLRDSRTLRGTAVATAGNAAAIGVITDTLGLPPEVAGLLPTLLADLPAQQVALIAFVVAMAGNLFAAWARHDDQRSGRL